MEIIKKAQQRAKEKYANILKNFKEGYYNIYTKDWYLEDVRYLTKNDFIGYITPWFLDVLFCDDKPIDADKMIKDVSIVWEDLYKIVDQENKKYYTFIKYIGKEKPKEEMKKIDISNIEKNKIIYKRTDNWIERTKWFAEYMDKVWVLRLAYYIVDKTWVVIQNYWETSFDCFGRPPIPSILGPDYDEFELIKEIIMYDNFNQKIVIKKRWKEYTYYLIKRWHKIKKPDLDVSKL